MPELGDQVRIYFPSNKEEEGIAISSVSREIPDSPPPASRASGSSQSSVPSSSSRSSGGGGNGGGSSAPDRMADPAIKTFKTKYGKEIMLAPDKIVISAGGMSITISDDNGISIVSNANVNITAGADVLVSGKSLHIAAEKLELDGKGNKITLEDTIKIEGSEVKMN